MNTDTTLVSIGMPVYNGAALVAASLTSLLAQTHRNIEVLVSDNASTDATPAIVAEIARRDPRVRYVRNETNIGILENFHAAARRATGPFFMWAAHDDLWEPTFVAELLALFAAHPELGLAYSNYDFVDESGRYFGHGKTQCVVSADSPLRDVFSFSPGRGAFHNVCLHYLWRSPFPTYGLFRTEAVLRALPFEYLFEDCNWADTIFLMKVYARERVGSVDRVLFHSRTKDRESATARSTYLAPGAQLAARPSRAVVDRLVRHHATQIAREAGFSPVERALLGAVLPAIEFVRNDVGGLVGRLGIRGARGA